MADTQIELAITGMTCASCAARIERKLNKMDGVTATVNYATEKARVTFPEDVDPQSLVEQVEAAGYQAALPVVETEQADVVEEDPTRVLRQRLIGSTALSVPVVL